MIIRRIAMLLIPLVLIGCGSTPVRKNASAQSRQAAESGALGFPESQYLTAKGIGQSEPEACRQAMAALSAIFEANIESEVRTRAESVVDDSTEAFRKSVEEAIRVRSAVTLQGARIGKNWQQGGYHYALAVLDKSKARADWTQQIVSVDNRVAGEMAVYNDPETSALYRLRAANAIGSLWIDRQLLESRLRIIDAPCGNPNADALAAIVRNLPEIRSRMRICIDMSGPGAATIRDRIAERLTGQGFVLTGSADRSDVLIQGISRIDSLDLDRENWEFVRATVSLALIDRATGARVAEISENTRAAHLTRAEATSKALAKVAGQAAEQIAQNFISSGN